MKFSMPKIATSVALASVMVLGGCAERSKTPVVSNPNDVIVTMRMATPVSRAAAELAILGKCDEAKGVLLKGFGPEGQLNINVPDEATLKAIQPDLDRTADSFNVVSRYCPEAFTKN